MHPEFTMYALTRTVSGVSGRHFVMSKSLPVTLDILSAHILLAQTNGSALENRLTFAGEKCAFPTKLTVHYNISLRFYFTTGGNGTMQPTEFNNALPTKTLYIQSLKKTTKQIQTPRSRISFSMCSRASLNGYEL